MLQNNLKTDSIPNNNHICIRKRRSIDRQALRTRTNINLNALQLGDEGIEYLVSKPLDHICSIKLWKNNLTHQGILSLTCNNNSWNNLKQLFLNCNVMGNKGCLYLSKGSWQALETLSLYNNQIDKYGCSHLAKRNWNNLKELSLDNNKITEADELNKIKADNLVRINLDLNPLTYLGYMSLLKSELTQIEQLSMVNNFFRNKKLELKILLKQKYSNLKGISF